MPDPRSSPWLTLLTHSYTHANYGPSKEPNTTEDAPSESSRPTNVHAEHKPPSRDISELEANSLALISSHLGHLPLQQLNDILAMPFVEYPGKIVELSFTHRLGDPVTSAPPAFLNLKYANLTAVQIAKLANGPPSATQQQASALRQFVAEVTTQRATADPSSPFLVWERDFWARHKECMEAWRKEVGPGGAQIIVGSKSTTRTKEDVENANKGV